MQIFVRWTKTLCYCLEKNVKTVIQNESSSLRKNLVKKVTAELINIYTEKKFFGQNSILSVRK